MQVVVVVEIKNLETKNFKRISHTAAQYAVTLILIGWKRIACLVTLITLRNSKRD